MKPSKLILIVPILILLLTSCDAISHDVQGSEQLQVVDDTEKENIGVKASVKKDDVEVESYTSSEWEPRMIKAPISQIHKRFDLPESSIQKIKIYFYNDIDANNNVEKKLDESDYVFEGYVSYADSTLLNYSFEKEANNYLGINFYLAGDYRLNKNFTISQKDIIYKMLEVSGAENPKQFFQELLDSPEITKYTGCTVQLKEVKYGVIDLTSCKEDDATIIALYNPELE